jgi:anti-sigma regulatory factor (Ser/Thr protein kinase)
MAARLGLDETRAGAAALVTTELARNVVLHGRGGEVLLRAGQGALDILAVDKGPGIRDVAEAMRDGHSTAGTSGIGLGAVRRQSSVSDIFSTPGGGTTVFARHFSGTQSSVHPGLSFGAVCIPKHGETACGDALDVIDDPGHGRALLLVVDGLGHGPDAARAAATALRVGHAGAHLSPARLVQQMHEALHATRGAAVAVLELSRQGVRFAGVGNISGVILSPGGERSQSMVSENGIVGHQLRKVTEFTYEHPPGATLVLHSDGLGSQWKLDRYPGLLARHPALLAGVLYRDFTRGRDDVSVLVARHTALR